jgi:hypothetical protein
VFEKVRLARAAAHFARERLPHYGPLLTEDLHRFRDEIVKATVGAAISATAALLFCCFVSLAVILSAAEGTHRSLTAWVVCACWGYWPCWAFGQPDAPSQRRRFGNRPSWHFGTECFVPAT